MELGICVRDLPAAEVARLGGFAEDHGYAEVYVPDIRGGFAHVLAAAAAEGQSVITGVHHLDRGYHRPLDAFAAIGLQIERVEYQP